MKWLMDPARRSLGLALGLALLFAALLIAHARNLPPWTPWTQSIGGRVFGPSAQWIEFPYRCVYATVEGGSPLASESLQELDPGAIRDHRVQYAFYFDKSVRYGVWALTRESRACRIELRPNPKLTDGEREVALQVIAQHLVERGLLPAHSAAKAMSVGGAHESRVLLTGFFTNAVGLLLLLAFAGSAARFIRLSTRFSLGWLRSAPSYPYDPFHPVNTARRRASTEFLSSFHPGAPYSSSRHPPASSHATSSYGVTHAAPARPPRHPQ